VRWEEVFAVFVVSHLVGDYLLQTDWQARHKHGGLSQGGVARRALVKHTIVYTACFAPALVWVAANTSAWALALAPLIFVGHLIQDDTRLLKAWNRRVKGGALQPGDPVFMAIDQSFHVVFLFGAALLAVA
jgi:Protein of unknown function (DUF3307)